jgi:hypothetical protein
MKAPRSVLKVLASKFVVGHDLLGTLSAFAAGVKIGAQASNITFLLPCKTLRCLAALLSPDQK